MKKTIALLLALMLAIAVLPAAACASGISKTAVYRTTAPLNLRKGAGTKYKKIVTLPRGAAFTVTKKSGNWYKVKVLKTGKVGWLSKTYTARNAYARVTTPQRGLNVRTGPAEKKYTVIDSIPRKTKNVTVKYISGNWAYVTYRKLSGWASRTFLAWMA